MKQVAVTKNSTASPELSQWVSKSVSKWVDQTFLESEKSRFLHNHKYEVLHNYKSEDSSTNYKFRTNPSVKTATQAITGAW